MNNEASVQTASGPSSGARFYKCAFQVNPFDYVIRHKKTTEFADEATYNAAITKKCQQLGIEIIAVTDHYRVRSSAGLWVTARKAGISVFPGFEAVTKDGIHLLCLFDLNLRHRWSRASAWRLRNSRREKRIPYGRIRCCGILGRGKKMGRSMHCCSHCFRWWPSHYA